MDNSEIVQKLENIEILLTANIESMNDPERRAKEVQILIKASKELNTTSNEIKELVVQERKLLQGFNPTVEHKHYSIDMKNPIIWVVVCLFFCIASVVAIIVVSEKYQKEKALVVKYFHESDTKDWNYMKYKWQELFGDNATIRTLKAFDVKYQKDWKIYDKQTVKREQELDEAERTRKEAELKAGESKKLQRHADSLNQHADSLQDLK